MRPLRHLKVKTYFSTKTKYVYFCAFYTEVEGQLTAANIANEPTSPSDESADYLVHFFCSRIRDDE